MLTYRFAARILAFAACAGVACADTIFLKNGEKLEGRVLSETDTELTVLIQVTPTIKDERVLKKEDVDKVFKITPDAEAWTPLALLEPGADSLEREDYARVQAALEAFIRSFPESARVKEAQKKIETFAAEARLVDEGQVKLDGQWFTKEKLGEERIQIGGRILLNRMKRAAAGGQYTDALNIFDQMEKGFKGAASYPDAVDLAKQVLPPLKSAVILRQAALKRRAEDNKQRLKITKGIERDQLAQILKTEDANAAAVVAAAERSGLKWLPLNPATDRSLASLLSRTISETARLGSVQTAKMRESVKLAEEANDAFAAGDIDGAEKSIRAAKAAWADYEFAKRIEVRISERKKGAPPKPAAPKSSSVPVPAPARPAAPPRVAVERSQPLVEVSQPSPTVPRQDAPSLTQRPAFYIALATVAAFGLVGAKAVHKHRLQQRAGH